MPNFLVRGPRARLLVPFALILALALAFAADAGAEVRSGENSSPLTSSASTLSPEAVLVKGTASYDSSTGGVSVAITTQAEPLPEIEKKPNPTSDLALLFTAPEGCTIASLFSSGGFVPPEVSIGGAYGESVGHALFATGSVAAPELGELMEVEKTVAGATTTFAFTSAQIANQSFNCAFVGVSQVPSEEELEEMTKKGETVIGGSSFVVIPLNGPPPTPAPQVSTPAPAPPAPAKLTVAKAKPLTLKPGKSKILRVKFTNTGGTPTGLGSVRAKAPTGFVLKPARQKLPVLLPGQSWTVSFHVQATAKAKSKATITVTGTGPGISSKRSFVVKALGG